MLAQLLRRLLLLQFTLGALLAWFLVANHKITPWTALAIPFLTPFIFATLAIVRTCVASKASEPWGPWWRSVFGEIWAGVLTFLLRQPWTKASPTIQPAIGSEPLVPVVLVHGFVCNHRIWEVTIARLRAQGHSVFAVNLEPLFGSIDAYAPIIDSAVQALCAHSGQRQVALVGHSMGGLAIRAWMRAFGTGRVARVVTLGTPHQGTAGSLPKPTTNSTQMHWRSDWLKALAASESAQVRGLIRIALTPQDNIVFPQRAQTLVGIEPMVFEGIGHVQMCTDADVNDWMVQVLGGLAV